ncbi:MAG: ABC transporter permease [Ktedonobacteraceae bacterium]
MNFTPHTPPTMQVSASQSEHAIRMGSLSFFSVIFATIRGELYKIRRRVLSKVLISIGIFITIAGMAVSALPAVIAYNSSPASFLPPSCSLTSNFNIKGPCLDHKPTQDDLALGAQIKQQAVQNAADLLHLPGSFVVATQIADFIGLILLVILAGTVIGGEYSVGTIRLLLTRGPTRTQFFLAKIGTLLACIALMFLILIPIGIAMGAVFTLLVPGITVDFGFFSGIWVVHALLFLLIAIVGTFVYTMLALCLATLGRATAAGVAGALVWWALEGIAGGLLVIFASLVKGPVGDFMKAIPDYFIGNNVAALLTNQSQYLTDGSSSSLSNLHAILVLTAYLTLFIGSAWWVQMHRDVTN